MITGHAIVILLNYFLRIQNQTSRGLYFYSGSHRYTDQLPPKACTKIKTFSYCKRLTIACVIILLIVVRYDSMIFLKAFQCACVDEFIVTVHAHDCGITTFTLHDIIVACNSIINTPIKQINVV